MTLGPGFSFDAPQPKDPPPGIGERGYGNSEELDAADVDRRIDAARDEGRTAFDRRQRKGL